MKHNTLPQLELCRGPEKIVTGELQPGKPLRGREPANLQGLSLQRSRPPEVQDVPSHAQEVGMESQWQFVQWPMPPGILQSLRLTGCPYVSPSRLQVATTQQQTLGGCVAANPKAKTREGTGLPVRRARPALELGTVLCLTPTSSKGRWCLTDGQRCSGNHGRSSQSALEEKQEGLGKGLICDYSRHILHTVNARAGLSDAGR